MGSCFLAELNKLRNVQKYLESQEYSAVASNKFGSDINLEGFVTKLDEDRKTDELKTTESLKNILRRLKEKKLLLKTEDVQNLDLKEFKQSMVQVQDEIHNLRTHLKLSLADLKYEEKGFSEEIDLFNKKMLEWEKPISIKQRSLLHFKVGSIVNQNYCSNNNKEVKEFMDFLYSSNGHENGWSTEDHNLFLKLRNKYNKDNFAEHLHKLLPDISIEEIKAHELWYEQYLDLKSKQKDALAKWKEQKSETRQQTVDQPEEQEEKTEKKIFKKTDQNLREKIAHWKSEKEEKRLQMQALEQSKREALRKKLEDTRNLQEELKRSVEQWKAAKQNRDLHEKLQKKTSDQHERRLRAMEANRMIKQFQSQDDLYFCKIKTRQKPKEPTKRSKSCTIAHRDPERLLKPTKQWLVRTSRDESTQEPRQVNHVLKIPKLHIPEWRRNTTQSS